MTTPIFIACNSSLALRNVRNADLGVRLKVHDYSVQVLVETHQTQSSRVSGI